MSLLYRSERDARASWEAVTHIDDEIKDKYPSVDWKPAKNMRNFLILEYFEVDFDAVWNTIAINLPQLKQQIILILDDLKNR